MVQSDKSETEKKGKENKVAFQLQEHNAENYFTILEKVILFQPLRNSIGATSSIYVYCTGGQNRMKVVVFQISITFCNF